MTDMCTTLWAITLPAKKSIITRMMSHESRMRTLIFSAILQAGFSELKLQVGTGILLFLSFFSLCLHFGKLTPLTRCQISYYPPVCRVPMDARTTITRLLKKTSNYDDFQASSEVSFFYDFQVILWMFICDVSMDRRSSISHSRCSADAVTSSYTCSFSSLDRQFNCLKRGSSTALRTLASSVSEMSLSENN